MASIKDAVCGRSTVIPTGVFLIRPETTGEEWTIHNVYVPFGKKLELYRSDDVTGVDLGIFIGPLTVSMVGQYNFHCTTAEFLLIKNTELTDQEVGYDGVVTNTA